MKVQFDFWDVVINSHTSHSTGIVCRRPMNTHSNIESKTRILLFWPQTQRKIYPGSSSSILLVYPRYVSAVYFIASKLQPAESSRCSSKAGPILVAHDQDHFERQPPDGTEIMSSDFQHPPYRKTINTDSCDLRFPVRAGYLEMSFNAQRRNKLIKFLLVTKLSLTESFPVTLITTVLHCRGLHAGGLND